MKNIFNFKYLMLAVGLAPMLLASCDKNKGEVSIEIISPVDNSTVGDASSVNIEVLFTAPDELEESEVSLRVDSVGAANIAPFPISVHEHVSSKTVSQAVNLSAYPSGTRFLITAESCADHNCTDQKTATATFLIP